MDKIALITGAGRGIGQAIAYQLASEDYFVILVSRTLAELQSTLRHIKENGGEGQYILCDVSDPTAVNRMISSLPLIDVLVNNAGCSGGGITEKMEDAVWEKVISVNLNSVYYVTKTALERNKLHRPASIINIASTGGKQGVIYGAAYSASKHGVIGFTKALGLELAKQNITVNAICPGFVETSMASHVRENYAKLWEVSPTEAKQRIEQRIPLGRYIQPEEVANMVGYLTSPAARGITAQAFNVCGGLGNY